MKIIISIFVLFFSVLGIAATPVHKIVVFGDSLSDNGNLYELMKHQLPKSPPYYEGRWSNGPVWVELLAQSYFPNMKADQSDHFIDYAYGGAAVSVDEDDELTPLTLQGQIDSYLLTNNDQAIDDSLFVIWMGSNNYLSLDDNMDSKPVISGINQGIELLLEKGAQHFVIVSLPDLGKTPFAPMFGAVDLLSAISKKHNDELLVSFNDFRQKYPQAKWTFVDLEEVHNRIENGSHSFSNLTDACTAEDVNEEPKIETPPAFLKMFASRAPLTLQKNCDEYLFFDEVHPTAPAHKIMADYVVELLAETGEIIG